MNKELKPDEMSKIYDGLMKYSELFKIPIPKWVKDELSPLDKDLSIGEWHEYQKRINGWQKLINSFDDFSGIKKILENVYIPETEKKLYSAYFSFISELKLENLLKNPSIGLAIIRSFETFNNMYCERYKIFHFEREKQKEILRKDYRNNLVYTNALFMLNKIKGLCTKDMLDNANQYKKLEKILSKCDILEIRKDNLRCSICNAKLCEPLPIDEINTIKEKLHRDTQTVLNKLSKTIIKGMIKKNTDRKIKAFVDAITLSNLENFAKLLDDDLLNFLKDVLKENH